VDIYKGKRVLITGDSGFKGTWLRLWLKMLGANVEGFSLNHNICEFEEVYKVFSTFRPEFVFHLAAQPIVRLSYKIPRNTLETNIMGTINVLESARNTGSVQVVIAVSSDKCYKNKNWVWGYRENDELGGHDPYSASKAAMEIVFESYRESFFNEMGVGAATVRAGNVIGGGDWGEDRIMPDCIRALIAKKPIVLRNPSATRPWQHVLDPIYGYLLLGSKLCDNLEYSGAWNFGPEIDAVRTVEDLANQVVKEWGEGKVVIKQDKNAVHEATLLQLNCDKAQSKLGWKPRIDFEDAVAKTVQWYKDVRSFNRVFKTESQIREYTVSGG